MYKSYDEFKNKITYGLPNKRKFYELVPEPEYLNKYDEDVQIKIIEWAEMLSECDERIERALVEERLKEERFSAMLSAVVSLLCLFAAASSFILSDSNPAAFLILIIPLMNLIYRLVYELNNE